MSLLVLLKISLTDKKALLGVADYDQFSDSHAWMITPEVKYKPFDGVSLLCGYTFIEGEDASKYGVFDKSDMVYFLLKALF